MINRPDVGSDRPAERGEQPSAPSHGPLGAAPSDADLIAQLRTELQERDDILAMAAHELRNPLHALALQLTLARNTAVAAGHDDVLQRIRKVEESLGRYSDRVTVLMDLMRGQGADYPLSVREFDLSASLAELMDAFASQSEFRGVTVVSHIAPGCQATSDPLVIEQAVDNLVINALKHSGCSEVHVDLQYDEGQVLIGIRDNGRGIAEEDQQRIFGKFSVARMGQRGSGTGLGLWIVRKLIAAVDGTISLNSAPGQGSTFTLKFPKLLKQHERT